MNEEKTKEFLKERIFDKKTALDAQIRYGLEFILPFTPSERIWFCQDLIDLSKRYKVEPLPLWQNMLDRPDFYNQWFKDSYKDAIEDGKLDYDEWLRGGPDESLENESEFKNDGNQLSEEV